MEKIYLFLFTVLTLGLNNNLKGQDVLLPEGDFKNFLISKYPSCFANVDANGFRLMNITCSEITTEDSLEFHNISPWGGSIDLDGIQYFTSLKYLDCSRNTVHNIPQLPESLLYLNMGSTGNIANINNIFPNSLRYLNIFGNRITALPFHLPDSLRNLDCSQNELSLIPELPSKLETLNCRSNRSANRGKVSLLTYLPELPETLTYLDCSDNAITSLPALPEGLINLNCSFMSVYSDPEYNISPIAIYSNLPSLPSSLKYFKCSFTLLTSLPSLPQNLLQLVCARNSDLTYLPELPESLQTLDCRSNEQLKCLPRIPQSLDSLMVAFNKVKCLPNSGNYYMDSILPLCNITNNINQCISNPVIAGNVFYDNNSNGIKDANENYRANVKVQLANGQSAYSDNNGHYEISAEIGINTLSVDVPIYCQAIPPNFTYSISSYDTLITSLIAFQPIASFDSLTISIIPINASRPGFNFSYLIIYENVGTTTVNPNITVNYNNDVLIYNSSSNASVVNSGASLTLSEVNFAPGERKNFTSHFTLRSDANRGDTLTAYANISVNSTSSLDSTFSVITGSFDPNDKQGTPKLSPQQVAGGKYIDYLIRFQNTGTDTAFNVVVTDTLDALLNDSSFQLVNSSHPCRVTKKDNKVGFEFLNIQLPDSIVNEPASHGFIRFRIKPQSSVTLNTVIPNEASIYFDYNTRVLTNTASTTIAENSAVVVPPAPATISSFAAFTNADVTSALLRWSTIGEYITDHFEIQEKTGSGNFINIATEPAIGTGNNSYSHNVTINADEVYYRIKMVNTDGSFIYSDEIAVKKTIQSSSTITIFNNPVNNTLRIVNNDASLNNTIAKLINAQGQVVMSITLTGGQQSIDVIKLASGVYYLKTKISTDRIRIINQ